MELFFEQNTFTFNIFSSLRLLITKIVLLYITPKFQRTSTLCIFFHINVDPTGFFSYNLTFTVCCNSSKYRHRIAILPQRLAMFIYFTNVFYELAVKSSFRGRLQEFGTEEG